MRPVDSITTTPPCRPASRAAAVRSTSTSGSHFAGVPQVADPRLELVLPAPQHLGHHGLRPRCRAAELGDQHVERAVLPAALVVRDDRVAPALPRRPRRQPAQLRLLDLQDLGGFVLRHRQQELFLALREVVEELALAGARPRPDVVEGRDGDAALADLRRGAFDDPLPRRGAFRGQLWTHRSTLNRVSRTRAGTGQSRHVHAHAVPGPGADRRGLRRGHGVAAPPPRPAGRRC